MHRLPLALYHGLPPFAQSAVATVRGLTLRRWRYGHETERLIADAIDREQWSHGQWHRWQQERLAYVLQRAATRVPYYRAMWHRRRLAGDHRSWDRLEHWPVLSKAELRAAPASFVADDCQPSRMFHEHTSGTTGTPLDLWWSRRTVREWYALFEARCRQWHGVTRHDRWAILGGQLIVPAARTAPPFWVWNAALNQLYMSTYHLSSASMPSYLDALRQYGVDYLWGYPSALYELAQCVLRLGRTGLRMRVVLGNAEPLLPYQREAIEAAFDCSARETYGMAEIVAAASECPDGALHLWPEVGAIEVLDAGAPAAPESPGDLVATGLLNVDMPLIRYAVGDRIVQRDPDRGCACGRRLPLLAAVHGRADDTLVAGDGRRLVRLDSIFKAGLPISEAQIVQESLTRLRVRFVPTADFGSTGAARLRDAVRARVGEFDIVLEPLARVPRGSNGKFRAVVCAIPPAERPQ